MGKEKNLKEMVRLSPEGIVWPYLILFIERKETLRRQREITPSWEIIVLLPNTSGLARTAKSLFNTTRRCSRPSLFSAFLLRAPFWNDLPVLLLNRSINECRGNHSYHVNATCMNTLGSHVYECHPGYAGNEQNCTGEFNLFPKYSAAFTHNS